MAQHPATRTKALKRVEQWGLVLLLLGLIVIYIPACTSKRTVGAVAADDWLTYAAKQYKTSARVLSPQDGYPRNTDEKGQWTTTKPSGWTSGFYPGTLWYLYEYTQDPDLLAQAQRWTDDLAEQQYNTNTHDIGFVINDSFGHAYRLNGTEADKKVILQAAKSLATRYNPQVGATRSWSWTPPSSAYQWMFPVIVDNMMNLELLFWAAKNGGDPEWTEMAVQHALTSAQYHIREDGSTYHVVDFDPETGDLRNKLTWQGYADESVWSRGQAWALYGFTVTYRETGDVRFLETAAKVADFYLQNLPEDGVPYWDFYAPNIPQEERDASAGAIAASGLLELSTLVQDQAAQKRYRDAAVKTLSELGSSNYLTRGTNNQAVLFHCVGSRPGDSEIDVPIIYGDYYFVEALMRYKNLNDD